jgi:hypothetical protein
MRTSEFWSTSDEESISTTTSMCVEKHTWRSPVPAHMEESADEGVLS